MRSGREGGEEGGAGEVDGEGVSSGNGEERAEDGEGEGGKEGKGELSSLIRDSGGRKEKGIGRV